MVGRLLIFNSKIYVPLFCLPVLRFWSHLVCTMTLDFELFISNRDTMGFFLWLTDTAYLNIVS